MMVGSKVESLAGKKGRQWAGWRADWTAEWMVDMKVGSKVADSVVH